jgi:hypothetical protein
MLLKMASHRNRSITQKNQDQEFMASFKETMTMILFSPVQCAVKIVVKLVYAAEDGIPPKPVQHPTESTPRIHSKLKRNHDHNTIFTNAVCSILRLKIHHFIGSPEN